MASTHETTYTPLSESIDVDVAIVGGGITGLTAAYLLKQAGQKVAVLEKNTVGSATTGGTTGKVTSQHSLIYADLVKRLGVKSAGMYAEANQTALEQIGHIIKRENISCQWEHRDNYVYTTDPVQVSTYQDEARAAMALDLPASFEVDIGLPFQTAGAVKFAHQACFNAHKYAHGLAKLVHGNGSHIFEYSNVTGFDDGQPAYIRTKFASVRAKNIIVASKVPAFPLFARFSYAALEYPHTSYIVAGDYAGDLDGMYISTDKNHYSILPVQNGKARLLLIGGENHIPGLGHPESRYQKLAMYGKKHFGLSSIAYQWRAMDYLAYDNLPLIGKLYPWSKHIYVATGFKKWGLSTSMVAGMILRDMITGRSNPWTSVFDSTRLRPIAYIPRAIFK